MTNKTYNWKRFWCPRTGNINLSDGGYLYNPDSEFGHIYNSEVVPFDAISDVPCLVLLGEPGIGKSHAMQHERHWIEETIQTRGDKLFWKNLNEYGSEDRLVKGIFESSEFITWKNGCYCLHMFLDSLDECHLRIENLAALLKGKFQESKKNIGRLYLRIACRTAVWPDVLEDGLKNLWGEEKVQAYELVFLRRTDVQEAAIQNSLDPEDFLKEIDRAQAVPLAIKPVTLNFLIKQYQKTGRLPQSQNNLYREGCLYLSEETNESYIAARRTGNLSKKERLIVASRIADVTILSNRTAVWLGSRCDLPENDIPLEDLCGSEEDVDGNKIKVDRTAIQEVITTGLFSSRGPSRMGFAHQTYLEFLAAFYLDHRAVPLPQLLNLFVLPGDDEGKIIPQLQETAAWLAGISTAFFRYMMDTNPEVLLRSDVAKAEPEDRAKLTGALLELYAQEKLHDRMSTGWKHYGKLKHPSLSDQLLPFISDTKKNDMVRRAAIEIAAACQEKSIQSALLSIILDKAESPLVRHEAADALEQLGDAPTKARLKPMILDDGIGPDPDDQIRGSVLSALWPGCLDAIELFSHLPKPQNGHFIGSYAMFLSHGLITALSPADLPIALEWVVNQERDDRIEFHFKTLAHKIMQKAWDHLLAPGILHAFAKAVIARQMRHDEILEDQGKITFKDILSQEDVKRHHLIEALFESLTDSYEARWLPMCGTTPLAYSKDLPWLLDKYQQAESHQMKAVWLDFIHDVFDMSDFQHISLLYEASLTDQALAEKFAWLLRPVKLKSPEAKKMKADYIKKEKWQNRDQDRPLLEPPPRQRIANLLDLCECKDVRLFWRLLQEMSLEANSTHYQDNFESDIMTLPGWRDADNITRSRIIRVAERFLCEQNPDDHNWRDGVSFYLPILAGYKALRLLYYVSPQTIDALPPDRWKKWAPTVLIYPSTGHEDEIFQQNILQSAYQFASDEIVDTVRFLIDKRNRKSEIIDIVGKLSHCWDDHVFLILRNKMEDDTLTPRNISFLLNHLLDHKYNAAKEHAEGVLSKPLTRDRSSREKILAVAHSLAMHAEHSGWSIIWPLIQEDIDFGRDLMDMIVCEMHEEDQFSARLTEDQLADLYIWLELHQQSHQTHEGEDASHIDRREWRNFGQGTLLTRLKVMGTPKACDAVRRIIEVLPCQHWIRWVLMEAQNNTRQKMWIPPQPKHILEMTANAENRIIQDGTQLLDVLIESLKRLETVLHDETSRVQFLWNDDFLTHEHWPKDETSLSDYVKSHFDDDIRKRGIAVNREVQIHRGQKTDLHIDAIVKNRSGEVHDLIKVIVEVKGCWNKELDTAMETQLVNIYLKDNVCQHGLYLIGWFKCNKWNRKKDRRKSSTPHISLSDARKKFTAQAESLSIGGKIIRAFVVDTSLH